MTIVYNTQPVGGEARWHEWQHVRCSTGPCSRIRGNSRFIVFYLSKRHCHRRRTMPERRGKDKAKTRPSTCGWQRWQWKSRLVLCTHQTCPSTIGTAFVFCVCLALNFDPDTGQWQPILAGFCDTAVLFLFPPLTNPILCADWTPFWAEQ